MAERMPEGDWRNFALLWLGQVVSMLGSGLTGFGLGVWVFERTSSVSDFTLIFVFGALPGLFLGPLVGALVDRWDRRWVMILADLGAVLATVALIIQLVRGQLELWQIYVIVAVGASCMTLQNPAFAATVPLLIPKKHLGRASGMMQLGPAASRILAPLLAGVLMPILHLQGLIAIDLATFLFAAVTLLLIRLPQVPRAAAPAGERPGLIREAMVGSTYIKERPGLVSLLLFFAVLNLLFASSMVLTTPLVLSFAGAPQLGIVLAVASAGMLAGSIVMSVWGGPKRKMLGILGFAPLLGASFLIIGAQPSVPLVALGTFALFFVVPIINGCDQAIWQTKVERGVQGRVFAMAQLISQFTAPIAYLAAGPLSDRLFEPMMRPGGGLANLLGPWIGVGAGRGVAVLFLVMGTLLIVASLAGFAYPRLRSLEDELPDAVPDPEPQPAADEGALPQPTAAEA